MKNKSLAIFVFIMFSLMFHTEFSYADKSNYRSPEQVEGAITTTLLEAKKLFDQGVVFVDVRNPRYYKKGHIRVRIILILNITMMNQNLLA